MSDLPRKMMERNGLVPGSVRAVVTVAVEVEVGAWGHDCTVAQAAAQAVEGAEATLRKALLGKSEIHVLSTTLVRVVYDAKKA